MAVPANKLTCGLCGFMYPQFNPDNNLWSPYYRAVYCAGPDPSTAPRLSGVGYHYDDQEDNYVPAEYHQRYDDADLAPLSMIQIRDIKPPGADVPAEEQADYAWGFVFHEACWGVLEQAVKPGEINIDALWRILCSVPCASGLPNWGHNYGGLYLGNMKDQAKGEHFVLLGRNSNLFIPSTFASPLRVPELELLVKSMRIRTAGSNDDENGDSAVADGEEITIQPSIGDSRRDPFAKLPLELREMLFCYTNSRGAANLRLSSRACAATPLTQLFFQSRFWPNREMHLYFDAFLLPSSEMRGTDWMRLYREIKFRLKGNRVVLGERNRQRLWRQTIQPLANAMEQVQGLGRLKGNPKWKWNSDLSDLQDGWKSVRTSRLRSPLAFGELRRIVYSTEIEMPESITGVNISFMEFFGSYYITGLRFTLAERSDLEIGYIHQSSEEYLPVSGSLKGFHVAADECGFRAVALITGQHMVSEYLEWAGNHGMLPSMPLKAAGSGFRRLRASFDGFRLQALFIPEK
ncbi:hypothetical protein BX600DRAFT_448249 [Xylariales sp. PMI_506]|nr:hypothetical protein BX600DRAFT_448249 [Xylariales sp. PMI_506]